MRSLVWPQTRGRICFKQYFYVLTILCKFVCFLLYQATFKSLLLVPVTILNKIFQISKLSYALLKQFSKQLKHLIHGSILKQITLFSKEIIGA